MRGAVLGTPQWATLLRLGGPQSTASDRPVGQQPAQALTTSHPPCLRKWMTRACHRCSIMGSQTRYLECRVNAERLDINCDSPKERHASVNPSSETHKHGPRLGSAGATASRTGSGHLGTRTGVRHQCACLWAKTATAAPLAAPCQRPALAARPSPVSENGLKMLVILAEPPPQRLTDIDQMP